MKRTSCTPAGNASFPTWVKRLSSLALAPHWPLAQSTVTFAGMGRPSRSRAWTVSLRAASSGSSTSTGTSWRRVTVRLVEG